MKKLFFLLVMLLSLQVFNSCVNSATKQSKANYENVNDCCGDDDIDNDEIPE